MGVDAVIEAGIFSQEVEIAFFRHAPVAYDGAGFELLLRRMGQEGREIDYQWLGPHVHQGYADQVHGDYAKFPEEERGEALVFGRQLRRGLSFDESFH